MTVTRLGAVHDGALILADPLPKSLEGKEVRVSVDEGRPRSGQANRRYWGVIVPTCGEILSQGRPLPLSKEQTHYVLKSAFLGCEETPLGLVPKDSHSLTTAEFSEYMDRIEAHFRSEFGAVFPDEPPTV